MRALQFENQNERLVYELTRLDRPGTPEKAVAVLLEKHPRKRHDANRSAITKPTRWDEGDLHTAHDYFKKTKNSIRPIITDDGKEVEIECKENVFEHRKPLLEEMRTNPEHRFQTYAALMADNVPRGKYECGKYKQCMYSYDDVRAVVALVVDMDDHDYTDPAAMRTHLLEGIAALQLMWDNGQCGALPVPAIEDSGRGIHLWWIFRKQFLMLPTLIRRYGIRTLLRLSSPESPILLRVCRMISRWTSARPLHIVSITCRGR